MTTSSGNKYTIHLPSNVDTDEFRNTRSDFTVRLADPLILDGKWEVALSEAFIPTYWQNIYAPFNEGIVVSCVRATKDVKRFINAERAKYGIHSRRERRAREEEEEELLETQLRAIDATPEEVVAAAEQPENEDDEPVEQEGEGGDEDEETNGVRRTARALVMTPGWYTPLSFCRVFNTMVKELEQDVKKNKFRGVANYDKISKKIQFTLKPGERIRVKTKRMRKLLGFDIGQEQNEGGAQQVRALGEVSGGVVENFLSHSGRVYTLPHPAHFNANLNHMYVYSDIVEYSQVGDIYAPILKVINLDSSEPGKEVLHVEYTRPVPYPVKGNRINNIQIQLKDSLGELIRFERGVVLLALEFKKLNNIFD